MERYGTAVPTHRAARVVLSVAACAATSFAAFFTTIVATITWSGCFISCTGDGDPVGGFLLCLLAGALLAGGPALTGYLLRSRTWLRVAVWAMALGSAAAVVLASSA